MIRRANTNDIAQIINLLHQGDMVHFKIRPDIFKPNTTKYNEQEISEMLNDDKCDFVLDGYQKVTYETIVQARKIV